MKSVLALLLGVALAAGCATSPRSSFTRPASVTERLSATGRREAASGRFLSHLSQAFEDHVKDCLIGFGFVTRALSRGTAEDIARLGATFR